MFLKNRFMNKSFAKSVLKTEDKGKLFFSYTPSKKLI